MTLYTIKSERLVPVAATSFADELITERRHLQQMLRADTSPLGEDLLVLAEEFGDWVDSRRRIDLLCLDRQSRLVVVELKRTQDGGHMDLQAIRYAAMVSGMTAERALAEHAKELKTGDSEAAARSSVMDFLNLDQIDSFQLSATVRIILVAADFSSEVTATATWLNRQGLDVRCVRLQPYSVDGKVIIDATQIIPPPEIADYEMKIRDRAQERERAVERAESGKEQICQAFWTEFLQKVNTRSEVFRGRSAPLGTLLQGRIGRGGFVPQASLTGDRARIECFVRPGKTDERINDAAFRALEQQRASIEAVFGEPLDWESLPERSGSRISIDRLDGGWKSPTAGWEAIQTWMADATVRLEAALRGPIEALSLDN